MLTILVCLQSRVGDLCQYSHSFPTLRRRFFCSLLISVSGIMPSGSKTWPGHLRYRTNHPIGISSSTSQSMIFGSGLKTNSILSWDYKSSTHRIDEWDSCQGHSFPITVKKLDLLHLCFSLNFYFLMFFAISFYVFPY